MYLQIIAAVLLLATKGQAEPSPYAQLPSAQVLEAAIRKEGASVVLWKRLWPNESVFGDFLQKISSADPQWLALSQTLKVVSDAGASEMMEGAMSRALTTSPGPVLPLLSDGFPGFPVEEVCSGAQVATDESDEGYSRWLAATHQSLLKFRPRREVQARYDECVAVLDREIKRAANRSAPPNS